MLVDVELGAAPTPMESRYALPVVLGGVVVDVVDWPPAVGTQVRTPLTNFSAPCLLTFFVSVLKHVENIRLIIVGQAVSGLVLLFLDHRCDGH